MKRLWIAAGLMALACGEAGGPDYPYFEHIFSHDDVSPGGLRYHAGYIYFLDLATGELWRVDTAGGAAVQLGPSGYQFDVSSGGIAVVSFDGENRVDVYDLSGSPKYSRVFQSQHPLRVRYDPDGTLYVAELTRGDRGPLFRVEPDSGARDTVFPEVGGEFCVAGDQGFYFSPAEEEVVVCDLGDTTTRCFWTGKPERPEVFLDRVTLDMSPDGHTLLVSPLLMLDTRTGTTTLLHTSPYDQGTELEGSVAWGETGEGFYFSAASRDTSSSERYSYPWAIWFYANPE